MQSEKPYTKLENVISRFSWYRKEEKMISILKKIVSKSWSLSRYDILNIKFAKS